MDADAIAEVHIVHVLHAWGHARDGGDWAALADCFCADATIDISWFRGPAAEFVARSKEIVARRKRGAHQKHIPGGPLVRVAGGRAFSICHMTLENRDFIDGCEFDMQAWFRFFDLLRRESDGRWRIWRRTAVYEKDRISPVEANPAATALLAGMDLSAFAPATKYLSWWQARGGRSPRTDIISVYSEGEAALKRDGAAWLRGEAV